MSKLKDMPKVQITKAGEFGHGTLMFACPQCMGNDIHMVKSETKRELLKWTMGAVQQETYVEHYICDGCKCEFDSESTKRKPYKFGGIIIALVSLILLIFGLVGVIASNDSDGTGLGIVSIMWGLIIAGFGFALIDDIYKGYTEENRENPKNPPDGDDSVDSNG